jgi:hypothetical protein
MKIWSFSGKMAKAYPSPGGPGRISLRAGVIDKLLFGLYFHKLYQLNIFRSFLSFSSVVPEAPYSSRGADFAL